jgi:predicted AlkP superfamily phosphohydrolase/phosphomutase
MEEDGSCARAPAAPGGNGQRRLMVIGLDSVPPEFLFDRFLPKMPRLSAFLKRARFGTLRSTDPPITVPAWAVMFTGMDPGSLGLYGFRHRRPGTYHEMYTPTPQTIVYPTVWDILSRMGRRVAVLGMPPGYPPPTVNGIYVSDFLTPDTATDFVTPASLGPEITRVAGRYDFDITYRADDAARVERDLFAMTEKRFKVARYLWQRERWDFFALHEIGPDRLHHAFWRYIDPTHPKHIPDPKYMGVADRYYAMVDRELGALWDLVPDDVAILVVSDHGSQAMTGCFCINEWLIQHGYLTLRTAPKAPGTAIEAADIDWSRTIAWGAGGYYARIFFNVRGREPRGILAPADLESTIQRLTRELAQVTLPNGSNLAAQVLRPSAIYRSTRGDPPDLMLYFGHLKWRSAGTIGHRSIFLDENDTGPDHAVHSFDGVFALADPGHPGSGPLPPQSILDMAPTLLKLLGAPVPAAVQGSPISALLG